MYGIAILDSGNYALKLCSILERKGYVFELIPTPCQIAKSGCSYCLKFPLEYKEVLLQEAFFNGINIRELYKIEPELAKNKYVKIF